MIANKKWPIDGNAFLALVKKNAPYLYCMIAPIVCLCPTVDAVEVVRCKGCKQWVRNSGVAESPNGHCFCHDIESNGYDFCSYGERKEDP